MSVSEIDWVVDRMMHTLVLLSRVWNVELLLLFALAGKLLLADLTQQNILQLLPLSALAVFDALIKILLLVVVVFSSLHKIKLRQVFGLSGNFE